MADGISRRGFLVSGAALTAGAAAGCLPGVSGEWPGAGQALCPWQPTTVSPPAAAGRVLEIHDDKLTNGGKLDAQVVAADLKKLLLSLSGKDDLQGAWGVLIPQLQPNEIVGIKVNALAPRAPSQPLVVKALVDLLKQGAGLRADQLVVWDRRLDELTKAGLTAAALGATVEGTWDDTSGKGNGRGYEHQTICLAGRKTHLCNILTRRVDHLINLAVVKRHGESGVTGVMKNHYGSIDNPGEYHDKRNQAQKVIERRFETAIPDLNLLDEVRSKSRLWLLDATLAVCAGGTESPADCVPNRLVGGLDPVALDVRARQIRDEMRVEKGYGKDPETISDAWLDGAEKVGLGSTTVKLEKVS